MSEMFESIDKLSSRASFYLERSKVIQSNIANADTPGYIGKDITFKKVLEDQLALKREDPKHIDPAAESQKTAVYEIESYMGYDENRIDVQNELAKLAESSIMYKSLVETMKKEFSKLKLVITGR